MPACFFTSGLAAEPDVAERLVIEITETAAFANLGLAVDFADRLRGLGCCIAVDDFGASHATRRRLLALKPDIAKVDALYLRLASVSPEDAAVLHHLVGLAGSLATTVVVEGVETGEMLAIAERTGAAWFQGHFVGAPRRRLTGPAAPQPSVPARDPAPPRLRRLIGRPRLAVAPALGLTAVVTAGAGLVALALHAWGMA